jgi:2-methylcitrate dehydratase PrpD
VTDIRVYTNTQGNQAVGQHREANTVVQAQFSIRYNIACALVNGAVGLSDFTSEALSRPAVRTLAARVTPLVAEDIERSAGRNVTPARVEAVIDDQVFSAQVDEAKGGLQRPMSAEDLRCKLEDCLDFGGFDSSRASAFDAAIERLEDSDDVAVEIRRMIGGVLNR